MINDKATQQVAIEFTKWVVFTRMWQTDLTMDELYECWMKKLDDDAYDDRREYDKVEMGEYEDMGPEYDSAGYSENDRIVEGQYRVVINK